MKKVKRKKKLAREKKKPEEEEGELVGILLVSGGRKGKLRSQAIFT